MAALSNLSVSLPGNSNLLMPKLQYRFRLVFENFGLGGGESTVLTRQVVDCSRPSLTFQTINLPVYNSTVYIAGKHTWATMSINLRDDITGGVTTLVGSQVQKQLDMLEQSSARSGADYKFRLKLDMLDGGNGGSQTAPRILEQWDLEGCFLTAVNYNAVNYGTSEAVLIGLTVQYDNAVQTTVDGAVGGITEQIKQQRGSVRADATGEGATSVSNGARTLDTATQFGGA
jgi:hypothetical protein